jgi:hypothetical protein
MAKRRPRLTGRKSKAWETTATRHRRRAAEESGRRVYGVADSRDLATQKISELEPLYQTSRNIALVLEALRWCVTGDCCPLWIARAVTAALLDSRDSSPLRRWWRQHQSDLIHLRRFTYFEEGRRRGLSRGEAANYATEMLQPTRAGGSVTPDAILQSVKLVRRLERSEPGRLQLTAIDSAWLATEFPQTDQVLTRETTIAKRFLAARK